jgi:hypothetical protein
VTHGRKKEAKGNKMDRKERKEKEIRKEDIKNKKEREVCRGLCGLK